MIYYKFTEAYVSQILIPFQTNDEGTTSKL